MSIEKTVLELSASHLMGSCRYHIDSTYVPLTSPCLFNTPRAAIDVPETYLLTTLDLVSKK